MNFSFNLEFLFEENIRRFSVASEDITYSKRITYAVYSGNIQFLVVITSGWWRLQRRGIQMYSSVPRLNSGCGQADGNLMSCPHRPHNRAQLQVAMEDMVITGDSAAKSSKAYLLASVFGTSSILSA